jgi:hypothetical protein
MCLSGCAARQVTPVRMTQAGDEALDCAALSHQIQENRGAAAALLQKDKQVESTNTAKVVAGALPYVGPLFTASTDLSNEEQVKARAISDRNDWLLYLARKKGCPNA